MRIEHLFNRSLGVFAVLFLTATSVQAGAVCGTTDWQEWDATSAVGMLNGITISASTTSSSEFGGFGRNHFAQPSIEDDCGAWDATMPLTHDDLGLIATNVNAGDTHEFSFDGPFSDGFFYIENFDAGSIAKITAVGATDISLVGQSTSIGFSPSGDNMGVLSSSNMGFDGEGDAILMFTGDVTSILVEYSAGEGANGILYTFAEQCEEHAVPEPTSLLVMAGLFAIGGVFYVRKQK